MKSSGEKRIAPIVPYLDELRKRGMKEGGFAARDGGEYGPDATAWAVLALEAAGMAPDLVEGARRRLAAGQGRDGSVCVSADHPEAFWPTPLAVIAWQGSQEYREPNSRAVRFLVATTGRHWARTPDHPVAHDTSLRGWPWIADTHSMVEPTSLAILALRATGLGDHERLHEAVRMLMDRQLPSGGWNYGNTEVYGQELYPQPENTGMALDALSGRVPPENVRRSMDYLASRIRRVRTPLSLGWGILGLSAWGKRPVGTRAMVLESLARQKKYGPVETTLLSLLIVAFHLRGGLSGTLGK